VEEVELDHRVHSRLIGAKGRGIHKIMEDFNVDIKFPGRDSNEPDLVVITGSNEDAVLECKEHLLNLEDEYVSLHISLYLYLSTYLSLSISLSRSQNKIKYSI